LIKRDSPVEKPGFLTLKIIPKMEKNEQMDQLTQHLKQYVRTTIEIIKLELIERSIIISSYILLQVVRYMLFTIALLILSIALGFYISNYLNDYIAGFGFVGTIYLLIAMILSVLNQRKIEKAIQNKIIRNLFSEEHSIKLP
jgi:ABC-type sugar transport system permease subunit